jgi:hypothetical protein
LAAALVGGCSSDNDVASLDRGEESQGSGGTAAETALAMADCLVAEGIPASAKPDEAFDGALVVRPDVGPDDYWQMTVTVGQSDGATGADGRDDPDGAYRDQTRAAKTIIEDKYLNESDGRALPHLLVGRDGELQDLTEPFVGCLESTGYEDPTATPPSELLQFRQRDAEAGAKWAECARSAGWAGVKDPETPTLETVDRVPIVLLPSTITEDQLRALLADCPNWDQAAHEEEDRRLADPDYEAEWDELIVDPGIGFDVPGYNGETVGEYMPDPKLDALFDVLLQEQREYYDARQDSQPQEIHGP